MIPTKRLRRTVAALALPAALLFTAACGSDDGESSSGGSSDSAPSGPVATVTGQPGELPEISVGKNATVGEETVSQVLAEGDGDEVVEGAFIRLDVLATTVESDTELLNTWQSTSADTGEGEDGGEDSEGALRKQIVTQAGQDSYLPKAVTEPLIGEPVGTRLQVEGRATELFGDSVAQQYGFSDEEGVVWVLDVAGTADVDLQAEAEGEQAAPEEGMPEVEAGGKKPATITVPEGQEPPGELQEQVLIEGDGHEVEAGDALVVQYTGVLWDTGEKFDSSWDRDSASGFQIGTGSVVEGWDQGLVGKHVGDRVLLVIPSDLAYGEEGTQGIPGGSTLVFVVDILAAD
ncbi:FKBP-type peptidyl-prolyl cis-trans isomerase [Streptomyces sp. 4N509B]|uniref:FKBP-type peptidyl-prolyl cis-trans isomerase n=1 Tax=Streptomyces sp. 4N509B TaxID=3457413 RepID=UPI003FD1B115